MIKKLIVPLAALALSACLTAFASSAEQAAPNVGDVVGYTLYTDIRAYINGVPIKTYNIGGRIAVCAADLAKYGFDVVWDDDLRESAVKRNFAKEITGKYAFEVGIADKNKIGKQDAPILFTDIKSVVVTGTSDTVVAYQPNETDGFNIDGKAAIYLSALMPFAESYEYDDADRSVRLTLADYWARDFGKDADSLSGSDKYMSDYEQMMEDGGFFCEFEKNQNSEFEMTDGSFGAFDAISLNTFSVGLYVSDVQSFHRYNNNISPIAFTLREHLNYSSDFSGNYWEEYTRSRGTIMTVFIRDPNEDKAARERVFRVYIDGKSVDGALHEYIAPHYRAENPKDLTYTFVFDQYYPTDGITKIRIEVDIKEVEYTE